jgi:tetratricopeptide (TPR) repeat protein
MEVRCLLSLTRLFRIFIFSICTVGLLGCQRQDSAKVSLEKVPNTVLKNDRKAEETNLVTAIKKMDAEHGDQKEELKALNRLITLLSKDKNFNEADTYAQKALSLAERVYGPDSREVLSQVSVLKMVVQEVPDKARESACLDRMIDLQAKATGWDSMPVMWLLDEYARSKSPVCGEKYESKKLRQLIKLREKLASPDDVATTQDRMVLADTLILDGEKAEALNIYDHCLKLSREKLPGLLPDVLYRYGKICLKLKQNEKGIEYLREAYSLVGPGRTYNPIQTPELAGEFADALANNHHNAEAIKVYSFLIEKLKANGNAERVLYFESRLKDCQKG